MAGAEGGCPGRRRSIGAGEGERGCGESVVEGGVIVVAVEEGVKERDEESVAGVVVDAAVAVLCSEEEDST